MRRIFWLALGLGAGATAAVLSARWARQQRRRLAPARLGRQMSATVSDIGALARRALAEFRQGVAEREAELRASLGEPAG